MALQKLCGHRASARAHVLAAPQTGASAAIRLAVFPESESCRFPRHASAAVRFRESHALNPCPRRPRAAARCHRRTGLLRGWPARPGHPHRHQPGTRPVRQRLRSRRLRADRQLGLLLCFHRGGGSRAVVDLRHGALHQDAGRHQPRPRGLVARAVHLRRPADLLHREAGHRGSRTLEAPGGRRRPPSWSPICCRAA